MFDRDSGRPVEIDELKTYAEALVHYHLSGEYKFENGEPFQHGETYRRHVIAENVQLIGKEANGVGEFGEVVDPDNNLDISYKLPPVII